jgi:SNF2 family DNA or RNA helicase
MLLQHQKRAIEKFNGYAYLAWETGTGKTLTALKIAENFKNVLIICPASVVKNVWQAEIEKWNINLKRVKIISYDKFRIHYKEILNEAWWDFLILDEAHKLKNVRAQITKLIMKIFPKTYKIMLSGTPFEKPEDYYTQLRILRADHPFSQLSYSQYKFSFFKLHPEFNYIVDFISPAIKKAFLEKYVFPYVDFVKREDVVDLPSLIEDDKYFYQEDYLPAADTLFERLETAKEDKDYLQAFMAAYQISALQEEKIEYVCDFIMDNKQTIVFSYFLTPLEEIAKRLGRKNVYFIHGSDKRELNEALHHAEKPVLATYCISEGISLTKYKNIIFLNLPLAWRVYEQALSRVWRYGQKNKVYLQRLHHGIDFRVWEILSRKGDVLEELKKFSKFFNNAQQLLDWDLVTPPQRSL